MARFPQLILKPIGQFLEAIRLGQPVVIPPDRLFSGILAFVPRIRKVPERTPIQQLELQLVIVELAVTPKVNRLNITRTILGRTTTTAGVQARRSTTQRLTWHRKLSTNPEIGHTL